MTETIYQASDISPGRPFPAGIGGWPLPLTPPPAWSSRSFPSRAGSDAVPRRCGAGWAHDVGGVERPNLDSAGPSWGRRHPAEGDRHPFRPRLAVRPRRQVDLLLRSCGRGSCWVPSSSSAWLCSSPGVLTDAADPVLGVHCPGVGLVLRRLDSGSGDRPSALVRRGLPALFRCCYGSPWDSGPVWGAWASAAAWWSFAARPARPSSVWRASRSTPPTAIPIPAPARTSRG
jgi:hypothetical protein